MKAVEFNTGEIETMPAQAPKNETSEGKLKRLTNGRVNKALKFIRALAPLVAHKPTKEHTEKVFKALTDEVEKSKKAWMSGKPPETTDFSL